MARPESQALAGFFATPPELLPQIAKLIHVEHAGCEFAIVDPCAGEGEALTTLAKLWFDDEWLRSSSVKLYACELEAGRYKRLEERIGQTVPWSCQEPKHGDAFSLVWSLEEKYGATKTGAQLLHLNPPYDTDREHKRLEERWLRRFTGVLAEQGVLVFVVPFYALGASATTLATHYRNVSCFRFPGEHFDVFKQVVLVATKGPELLAPDAFVETQVRTWADAASSIPELPADPEPVATLVGADDRTAGFSEWKIAPLDLTGLLARFKPWHESDRGGKLRPIPGILPDGPIEDALNRRYPIAMPAKPAHIAAAIASGCFNGARIEPDAPKSKLPPLLLKGVFDKEFVAVDQKKNKDGETTGIVEVQQPRLVVTALDLRTKKLHTIASSADATGATTVAEMTTADLLASYGRSLLAAMNATCPVVHDPKDPEHQLELPTLARPLYQAQAQTVMAAVKLLGGPRASKAERRGKAAFVIGEIGSGKSSVALAVARTIEARTVLVMCPPHLLDSWRDQARAVLPDARTVVLSDVGDVDALAIAPKGGTTIAVLSRETAKLGHAFVGVAGACPTCGAPVPLGDLAKQRARCTGTTFAPKDRIAHAARALALKLLPVAPNHAAMQALFNGRQLRRIRAAYKERPGSWDTVRTTLRSIVERVFVPDASDELIDAVAPLLVAIQDDTLTAWVARELFEHSLTQEDWRGAMLRARVRNLLLLMQTGSDVQRSTVAELREKKASEKSYGHIHGTPLGEWERFDAAVDELDRETTPTSFFGHGITYDDEGRRRYKNLPFGSLEAALSALEALTKLGKWTKSEPCGELLYQAVPEPRRVPLATYIAKRMPKALDLLVLDECFVAGTKVDGRPIESIQVGDMVSSYDEASKEVVYRRVSRLWVKRPHALVRVTFSNGRSFACTPNHPIFTNRGWVAAGDLRECEDVLFFDGEGSVAGSVCGLPERDRSGGAQGAGVSASGHGLLFNVVLREAQWAQGTTDEDVLGGQLQLVSPPNPALGAGGADATQEGLWLLRPGVRSTRKEPRHRSSQRGRVQAQCEADLGSYEGQQPDAVRVGAGSGERVSERQNVPSSRRQWAAYEAATRAFSGAWVADRGCDTNGPRQGHVRVAAQPLQGGHWEQRSAAGDRGGRRDASNQALEVPGQAQGSRPSRTWVARTEVLEPGRDGTFGGVCPDGLVYNLEVEGTHTYFAEGVLVHNCHEYSGDGSAQGFAAHRLTGLGVPTLLLTGSVMGGYAESLFANQWALDPQFRAEFRREQRGEFVRRYGYLKQLVEDREKDSGKVVAYGSVTDRVERGTRTIGQAPGVLPIFLMRYLLRMSVTLHKSDLALNLPPREDIVAKVQPSEQQRENLQRMQAKLVAQIRKDQFGELAGKLMGQLAELPSYLDRCTADCGNRPDGSYVVAYPEADGGTVVTSAEPLPASTTLPKESWMLDTIDRELSEGRRVMVLGWHVSLLPRLASLIEEELDEVAPVLHADKVQASKRQAWIDREVIGKGRRVLVVNPVAVQTGLNNLVWFSSQVWMENPGVNAITFRQATGRIDRIGQKLPTRVYFPVYEATPQEQLHKLLLHKVGASMATDGLDAESAMQAAGVGDSTFSALSVGRQLFQFITGEKV